MNHAGIPQNPAQSPVPVVYGLAIIVAAVLFVGYRMWASACPAPAIVEAGVLLIIPVVYLVLMYLTFVSQD